MKKVIGIFMLCFLLAGCDSFLEEENRAGITNNDLYSTQAGWETLRTNAYSQLRGIYSGTPWLLLAGTDIYQMPRGTVSNGIYDYRTLYNTNGNVNSFYTTCYQRIQAVNAALYYIDSPTDMPAADKSKYEAELRFMRGFLHFLLVEQFGGIVINDEFTQSPRMDLPRATLAESYEYVIGEMTAALNGGLPQTAKDGQICKDIVNHYLGKVYLTRGWDTSSSADFNTAKSHFQAVFSSRGETLKYDFETLWSPDNENNDEVIFAIQYDASSISTPTSGNNQESLFGPYLGGIERNHKYMSTQLYPTWSVHSWFGANDARYDATFMLNMWEFYYDYYQGKNVPGTNSLSAVYPRVWDKTQAAEMEADFMALTDNMTDLSFPNAKVPEIVAFVKKWVPGFENADASTINATAANGNNYLRVYPFMESLNDAYENETRWRAGWASDFCQPVVKKFDLGKLVQFNTNQSYRDLVLATLSETLLLYAEACIGLNDYSTAETYINKVLARPGNAKDGGVLTITLPANQTDALEAYLKESGKELLGQYCGRWPELRRTKMLKHMYYKYNYDYMTGNLGTDPIGDKLYRPIPQDAIDINEGLTEADQNPGY